ncbi:tyrosine-type recombinase/integrase [Litchfieldia alkalitelluris]|uniref:tyrosine-type recombinase/integrase n=1 Tax=Litchfieldia alkalitelluris TaxID=304268 RepID=UPI00099663A8|nr:tyrosine-type recombinase/integrase [Litchfieldia alkalitelluris]
MEHVDPIRDISKINEIKKILKEQSSRDYLLFVLGINTGLKITEMLNLNVSNIQNEDGSIKTFLKTTNNRSEVFINRKVKAAILTYLSKTALKQNDYLFKSSKTNQPITRQQAYRIINNAAKTVGIEEKIGTNSLRKTFGYHAYKKGVAVSILQRFFNHSTPSETKQYLGVKQEEIKPEIDVNL